MALLEEDLETYILFAITPIYLLLLSLLQSKFLRYLSEIKSELSTNELKVKAKKEIEKLKKYSFPLLFIGPIFHTVTYLIFSHDHLRTGYFISILIFYLIFLLIAWINFWLKGSSILKDTGDFGGLPG